MDIMETIINKRCNYMKNQVRSPSSLLLNKVELNNLYRYLCSLDEQCSLLEEWQKTYGVMSIVNTKLFGMRIRLDNTVVMEIV